MPVVTLYWPSYTPLEFGVRLNINKAHVIISCNCSLSHVNVLFCMHSTGIQSWFKLIFRNGWKTFVRTRPFNLFSSPLSLPLALSPSHSLSSPFILSLKFLFLFLHQPFLLSLSPMHVTPLSHAALLIFHLLHLLTPIYCQWATGEAVLPSPHLWFPVERFVVYLLFNRKSSSIPKPGVLYFHTPTLSPWRRSSVKSTCLKQKERKHPLSFRKYSG